MLKILCEALEHAFTDSIKTLPFLFGAFLLMEAAEKYYEKYRYPLIRKSKSAGPVAGALLGCIPQCGFSVIAANLYAGGMITLGTLLAVFLSTSDEAILLLMADPGRMGDIGKLIGVKILIGIAAGYGIDLFRKETKEQHDMEQICHSCNCQENSGILKAAGYHTVRLFAFLFLFTAALNFILEFVGMEKISSLMLGDTVFQPALAALIGLIPNCAASVALTELYLNGALSFASVIAGLASGAGAGLLVLFRMNHNKKENFKIIGILYGISVAAGILIEYVMM